MEGKSLFGEARHTEIVKLVLAATRLELILHMHTHAHTHTHTLLNTVALK